MTEFINNMQNSAENEIKSSAEDSSSGEVDKVRMLKVRMLLCLGVIDLKVNLSLKMS